MSKIEAEPTKTQLTAQSYENMPFEIKVKDDTFIFIPVYMTLLIKGLSRMDFQEGNITATVTLLIRIATTNIDSAIIQYISRKLDLRINEETFTLDPANTMGVTLSNKKGLLTYNYRGNLTFPFTGKSTSAPFDATTANMKLELTSDFCKNDKFEEIKYRFNIHLCDVQTSNITFKNGFDKYLHDFSVNVPRSSVELIPEVKKQGKDLMFKYFPVASYKIELARNPGHLVLSTIVPLLILQFLGLTVFASEKDLTTKITNIAIILLVLVTYLPTLRSLIPYEAKFTTIDLFIYTCFFIELVSLLEAFITNYENKQVVTWILWAIAAAASASNFVILTVKGLLHRNKMVVKKSAIKEVKRASNEMDYKEWYNKDLQNADNFSGFNVRKL